MSEQESTLDEFIQTREGSGRDDVSVGELQQLEESPIESWQLVKLGEILSLEYGDNLPSGSRADGTIPVYGSNGRVDTHSEAAVNRPGIVLGRKGSIGEIRFSEIPFWPIDTTYYITSEQTDENLRFLYYLLENIQLERLNAASAIPGLNRNDTYGLNAVIPSLPEQRKIATVLYTVDQAIEATNEISDQIERLEKGLQQSLFSGEYLDCDKKEISTLGEIPEHWDTDTMGELCDITMGSSPKSEHYNESGDGLPFFQANNEFGLRNPKHDRWCSDPVKLADEGDSLMTLRGTYVGQMNIADRECCIGRGLAGISPGELLSDEYLYQHLRRRERYVKSIAIGSTFDSVSSGDLQSLVLSVPPMKEQKQIADTLSSLQNRLMFTKRYADQLQRVKQGLMRDLLSGTVRTTDINIQVPDEVAQHG